MNPVRELNTVSVSCTVIIPKRTTMESSDWTEQVEMEFPSNGVDKGQEVKKSQEADDQKIVVVSSQGTTVSMNQEVQVAEGDLIAGSEVGDDFSNFLLSAEQLAADITEVSPFIAKVLFTFFHSG